MKNLLRNPRSLAFLGLMLGITIIMDLTPLGMIPLGAISANYSHPDYNYRYCTWSRSG